MSVERNSRVRNMINKKRVLGAWASLLLASLVSLPAMAQASLIWKETIQIPAGGGKPATTVVCNFQLLAPSRSDATTLFASGYLNGCAIPVGQPGYGSSNPVVANVYVPQILFYKSNVQIGSVSNILVAKTGDSLAIMSRFAFPTACTAGKIYGYTDKLRLTLAVYVPYSGVRVNFAVERTNGNIASYTASSSGCLG